MIETNLFKLRHPDAYRCHVHRYYSGLSRLYLRVARENAPDAPPFFLLFADVGYFAGPMTWQGADVCIAPRQDAIDVMLHSGMIGEAVRQFPKAYAALTDYVQLYVIPTTQQQPIQIIASAASLLRDLPADLR